MEHNKAQVIIDLDEYQQLLKLKNETKDERLDIILKVLLEYSKQQMPDTSLVDLFKKALRQNNYVIVYDRDTIKIERGDG